MRGPWAGASANSGAVSDQRPCTCGAPGPAAPGEAPAARRAACRASVRRGARSGAKASLVTSPAQTRSQSASCSSAGSASRRGRRAGRSRRRRRAASRSRSASCSGSAGRLALERRRAEPAGVLAEVERHLAGAPAERAGADPDELAAGAELVDPGGRVGADAARQHVALPHLGRQRQALERHEHLAQAVDARAAGRRASTPCQAGRKRASARCSAGSTSLRSVASEARRSRRSTSGSHHSRSRAARAQLAADEVAGALELAQHRRRGRSP